MLMSHVLVYLDDILIYSPTLLLYRKHVKAVLQRLRENGLYAKLDKCEFEKQSLSFLGYVISHSGLLMDPAKVSAITQWPQPTDLRGVQRFLGFANYYRRFIRSYSSVIEPITALTRKGADPKKWPPAAVAAFAALKTVFT
ncbi:uncharacterized protein WCC33_006189 [Rhinophrynus dorsalis]